MCSKDVQISVVIPCFNVEHYVKNIINALIRQTYKNFEVILVDDGSKDNTIEIAESILSQTTLDWKIIRKKNGGQASARNLGIDNAKGEWIICPDSDDYIVPSTLEKLLLIAISHHVDCVFCNFKYVELEQIEMDLTQRERVIVENSIKFRKYFFDRSLRMAAPGMLLRKDVFEKVRYDEDCPFTEDTHFIWKLLYTIDSIAYTTGDFYNYLMRQSSTIHSIKAEKYLKTSIKFQELSAILHNQNQKDFYALKISPRQRLGSLRMMAKCNDYEEFKDTVIRDGYRKEIWRLLFCRNVGISLMAVVFCASIRLFYILSNSGVVYKVLRRGK